MRSTIRVIGIGDSGSDSLLPLYKKWIEESELLVGGERHVSFFPDYHGEILPIKGGLTAIVERIGKAGKNTVVLASGDPLFYGIGSYLAKKLPVEIYPGISSIQQAFALMKESWHDCTFLSVHGRSMGGLAQKVDGLDKVCLLTDAENNPGAIARYLLSFGMTEYNAFVAENLGGAGERTSWMTIEEMSEREFSPLNLVVLKRVSPSPYWPLGIPDEAFAQRKPDKGLITKKEIRVLSLAALELKNDSTVWDIGTCTGSMAIEAARLCREGSVFAIEKNEADLENCHENMRRFRTDFTAVHGKAPAGLETFDDPDAVFIGGSGGEMKELLHVCCSRLKPGGRIVLNAAAIETLYEAMQTFAEEGYQTSVTLAQISRSKPILHMNRFEGLNPVYIITASRKEEM
ncbi:bifunctional cobalt-precorrin-7 (C(5))-methyltransferase/cobalt-precorrin-6B (C(15))-methyltransferase [Aneurinibacillus terranovensis]|uniref:bifunctional cobalt-precorrin-7 (C(5))-methyltransferase/cobalt-precorrin-6B (C(15))-methyltransferase n=1 Tax=Aneurinibacillus terranovensis TaxID=278991 RepID=UPI0004247592|nr:bifunctional cobalt-precorrin-7 (C(5))-methyltransferase/cobalt-precorrin-6B (C(15))-methyltransferase [Aneurinibacillus terranovensis]